MLHINQHGCCKNISPEATSENFGTACAAYPAEDAMLSQSLLLLRNFLRMKKITCALLLAVVLQGFASAQAPAQDSRLSLSAEMKEPANSTIHDYLGEDENFFYVLRKKIKSSGTSMFTGGVWTNEGWILESYTHDLTLKLRNEIQPSVNNVPALLDDIKYLDGTLYAFILYVNRQGDQTELYFQPIDKKTLALNGSPKKIASIPYETRSKQGEFRYEVSKDKKTIAVISSMHDDRNAREQFKVSVFNGSMTRLWQKDITLPYESNLFEKEALLLDNKGNIYLSGRLYMERVKEKRKGMANYSYSILAYRDLGETSKEYPVSLKGEFITDLGFNITTDDKLAVAGFYSEQGTYSIKGICFTLIDAASGTVMRQGNKAFDASFLSDFSKQQVDKQDMELYRYSLDDIIIRSDGGVLLLAEQFYVREQTNTTRYPDGRYYTTTTYYYNYNDIIAVNVNPDMTMEWATKIPKRQVTTDDGGYYSSYASAIAGDRIYLLFNDHPDNLAATNSATIAKYSGVKNSVATLVTITADGKWKKSLLFSNKAQGEILRPKICEQVSANQFFLYGEKGKNYVVGKAQL